jgi:hypothetical protein
LVKVAAPPDTSYAAYVSPPGSRASSNSPHNA